MTRDEKQTAAETTLSGPASAVIGAISACIGAGTPDPVSCPIDADR
jgi:hypothetical protein